MAVDWPTISLREAGVSLIDCDHKTPPASDIGYPYIAIPQLKHGRIDLSDARCISREHLIDWTRKAKPEVHDVILSRRCNPGETAFVPPGLECALGQNLVLLRADGSKVTPEFLRWLVRGPEWWEQIGKYINVGAVFDSLRCADIPNFELAIPMLSEQRAIAHILGALDDKIELNRLMNQTLEVMARAIFKSWFVDFDPVRAKAEGRDPGLSPDLAALFPDGFENSELGEIPKGWRVMPVGEALKAVGGSTPSTSNPTFWDGGEYHWATPKDLSGFSAPILITTERKITKSGVEQISSGLLPVGTVLMSSRAPVGYLALCGIPVAVNQGFIAMICDGPVSNYYALNWCRYNMEEIQQRASGTTFAEISKAAFRPIPMIVPANIIMNRFTEIVDPLYKSISERLKETRTLVALRDSLLPKLLSGEIRVTKAEKWMSEMV